MMKALTTIILLTALGCIPALGQSTGPVKYGYTAGVNYTRDFVLGGYVRVRESELEGDKMALKDLGMTSYSALQLHLEKSFRESRSVALTYDKYYMRGSAVFDRDIAYNGTLIDGRKGIDVSPTDYYRISIRYRDALLNGKYLQLRYMIGLVFDHITFYLDGEVSPVSARSEVYEGFGKQALPYPVAGLQGTMVLRGRNSITMEVYGTHVPKFKSFYNEGGPMHLQYSTFESDVHYSTGIASWKLSAGAKFRYTHLFQESKEDTNRINTVTAGPYVGIAYTF